MASAGEGVCHGGQDGEDGYLINVVGLVGDGCGLSWVARGCDGKLRFVSLTHSVSSRGRLYVELEARSRGLGKISDA